jgi:Uma2 family endonuclease
MITDALAAPWAELVPVAEGKRVRTANELAKMPEDGWRYELVAGRLVRMPPPKHRRGRLVALITSTLHVYAEQHQLGHVYTGDTGYNLTQAGEDNDTVLGADVSFVSRERFPPEDVDAPYWQAAPDLAVEIASPSQYRPEMGAKAWLWLTRGARLVWVIWPSRHEVDVWTPEHDVPLTLGMDARLDGADVLPGFSYALADLFA